MDTAIKVTASTSFSLSIQVSKIGIDETGCLPLGGGQRSGLGCKDVARRRFRSASVVVCDCKLGIRLIGIRHNVYP